jgi:hypothetical protein
VNACRTIRLRAHGPVFSRNFADVFACQFGMLDNDRSIDKPDFDFWVTAGAFHQRCELNQFQR